MFLSVYKIENLENNRIYIGCTKNYLQRIKQHTTMLNCGRHVVKQFQCDYDAEQAFKCQELLKIEINPSILYSASQAMHGAEAYYTIFYNSDIVGYNTRHVATWRTRQEAYPVDPKEIIKVVRDMVKYHNKYYYPIEQIHKLKIVAPNDEEFIFVKSDKNVLKAIQSANLTPAQILRAVAVWIEQGTHPAAVAGIAEDAAAFAAANAAIRAERAEHAAERAEDPSPDKAAQSLPQSSAEKAKSGNE